MESGYKAYVVFGIAAIILFLAAIFISKENSLINTIKEFEFEENVIYLVVRGTDSKAGWIAKEYNQTNKDATHIAIGVWEENEFRVFHVSDELSGRGDNLFDENIFDFVSRDDLLYMSIWKINHINSHTVNGIKVSLKNSIQKTQNFDKEILIGNNSFYCSEYVNEILERNEVSFFKKEKIKLQGIPKSFLGRDTLEYYPVDGFMKNDRVQKIFEWRKED